MRTHLRTLFALPALVVTAACSSGPQNESTVNANAAISGSEIVARGMQWVNAGLHYCQSAHGAVDPDSSCWAWEGSSHVCDRESVAAWNAYRSDCSGFVTWSWGLPPVGDGGYVTGDFAPFSPDISYVIDGHDLQPGDALNKDSNEHIVLFERWDVAGHSAYFLEEPGCSVSEPYAHEFQSDVSFSGQEMYIDYEGAYFYPIRYNGSSGGGSPPPPGKDCSLAGHSYSTNTCTETQQCDNGTWVARTSDPSTCNSGFEANGGCLTDSGSVAPLNTCTSTLQCDDGVWVARTSDPSACLGSTGGGGGSGACSLGGHSYATNTCTETQQCDNGNWVARTSDPSTCNAGFEPSGECLTDGGSIAVQNTCTSTLQCDDGVWVDRESDPAACNCELAGHGYATNTCTETQQCNDGNWEARTADPSSCKTGIDANGACLTDSGSVAAENTCTSTLQCDDGVWVERQSDPASCL